MLQRSNTITGEQQRSAQISMCFGRVGIGLDSAESAIPGINDLLAELATLGLTKFQIEGPAVYCRPAGPSSAKRTRDAG